MLKNKENQILESVRGETVRDLSRERNITNFNSKNASIPIKGEALFYLSNSRSFQQSEELKELISILKRKLKGKQFMVKSKPPIFCRSYRIALLKYDEGLLKNITFTKIPCNSWTCPACCLVKARKVQKLIKETIVLNNMEYFLTLTIDPKRVPEEYLSPEHNFTHKYITKKFNHFTTVLKRKSFRHFNEKKKKWEVFDLKKQEEELKYIWVVEFQKNGNAHLHIVLNKFLPIKQVWKIWSDIGVGTGGYIEKIKTIQGISVYLSGYITKGLKKDMSGKSGFKYFERRFSISKSCIRPAKNSKHFLDAFDYKNLSPFERKDALKLYNLDWIEEYLYNPQYTEQSLIFNTALTDHEK